MRALPNMAVLSPGDDEEAYQMTKLLAMEPGPVYLRLFRTDVEAISPPGYKFTSGDVVLVRPGVDLTIFATGLMVTTALHAATKLYQDGIDARVVNIHTIKPLCIADIVHHAGETGAVVTVEEHSIIGGLGSAIAEALGESRPLPMKRVGIPDTFCESAPTNAQFDRYGLTAAHVVDAAHSVLSRKA